MQKNILSEVNRVREIMGLSVLLEQEVNPKEIRTIDGKRYEVTNTVLPPYKSGKWSATFKPGKFEGGDLQGDISGDITNLADYLNQDRLKNQKVFVAITAGSSKSPINPKGNLAKLLTSKGVEPNNAGLAELRGQTALNLVKSGLQGQIPDEIYNNIDFVVDLSQIEKGPDFVVGKDNANDPKYTPFQFLSATASAQATQETLAELPEICNTSIKGKGGQGKKASKGPTGLSYAVYQENDGLGKKIDLGVNTEGEVTFAFTAYRIPDMFQITYGDNVYTSSGPRGEGFVSNNFKSCEEGTPCHDNFTRRINTLEKSIGTGKDRIEKVRTRTRKLPNRMVGMLKYTNGLEIEVDEKGSGLIDLEWIENFFNTFTPEKKNLFKRLLTKKKRFKFNPKFKDGFRVYNEDGTPSDTGFGGRGKNRPVSAEEVWEKINDHWISLSDYYEEYEKERGGKVSGKEAELKKLKEELATLMETGSLSDYAEAMTRKLTRMGFPQGVIGTNGNITFDKVKGVSDAYLQVYAPLDSTAWKADVSCKDLNQMIAQG